MKKLIITIAALAISFGAFAQVNFGVKLGGNLSTISDMIGEDSGIDWGDIATITPSQSMKLGFVGGVYAEYMVLPLLGIQVEANFSMQGVNTKTESSSSILGASAKTEQAWSLNYVTIPILAKVHLGPIRAYAGPQLGFATNFNTKIKTTMGDNTNIQEQPIEDGFNTFDLAIALGAQYKLTPNLGVDARYNIGLTNLYPAVTAEDGEVLTEAFGKNGSLQFSVFYEF